MNYDTKLRIALFANSTRPSGSVVHTLELAEALHDDGHHVVVHAPSPSAGGFFRTVSCVQRIIPAARVEPGTPEFLHTRVAECVDFIRKQDESYDIYHAQDMISGAALAELIQQGRIRSFVRTLHRLDDFQDGSVAAVQERSVLAAQRCFCTSRELRVKILAAYGIESAVVPSGVDARRFTPIAELIDSRLRETLQLGDGPVYLAFGGMEPRKNTFQVLRAFLPVLADHPGAQLVIAGGGTVRDNTPYRHEFDALISRSGIELGRSVIFTGPLNDEQMPALYRLADALVLPTVRQGISLSIIEAMACGTPIIASAEAPFTEYLSDSSALLVDPADVGAITRALLRVTSPPERRRLGADGLRLSARFSWFDAATAHITEYLELLGGKEEEAAEEALQALAG